ncbi:hypothetical protein Lupro_02780 [Lutibacter profundi]|uniref:Uncharacterized protein n=1 Tax=Lutibacter profundi TaxID=1622118 RepID=A0A120IE16_9FLAO|nr:hypothetical protein [Lutibacter profundi]AMC10241.1 hypothetical protein Lupro_02780 [Lutibacter profundi]
MKKMKNYFKIGILLFGILFVLTNCEKEDLSDSSTLQQVNQKQNPLIISFKKNFYHDNFKDNFMVKNLEVDWNSYSMISNNDLSQTFEFKTNINSTISSNNKNRIFSKFNLIAIKDNKNRISIELIKYLSNDKNSLKK